jgi:electron transport complex protein RnfB
MSTDVYQKLAQHLDDLPAGFPATKSGVEQRILRRLFTPEDAELALSLTLLAEEPRVIARRAGIRPEEATRRLEAMEKMGLIFGIHKPGRPPRYAAQQFVVGIWEFQVNNLDAEFVRDVDEYLTAMLDPTLWKQAPQIRTVPVGEAIDAELAVLPYERAEELVRAHNRFAVAPCICRREKRLVGEGCDKPLETCLTFDSSAAFYERNGLGRAISREEALAILRQAEEAGLVLQPGNSKDPDFICCCCGCCCGVLRNLKRYPQPGTLVSSAFVATVNLETCQGCGTCTERCQMEAVTVEGDKVILDVDRCIGCGLCVSTCPTGSLSLTRKPESAQPHVPADNVETSIQLGRARGKMKAADLVGMAVKSKVDRLLART